MPVPVPVTRRRSPDLGPFVNAERHSAFQLDAVVGASDLLFGMCNVELIQIRPDRGDLGFSVALDHKGSATPCLQPFVLGEKKKGPQETSRISVLGRCNNCGLSFPGPENDSRRMMNGSHPAVMTLSQNVLLMLQLSAGQPGDGITERCAAQFQVTNNFSSSSLLLASRHISVLNSQ